MEVTKETKEFFKNWNLESPPFSASQPIILIVTSKSGVFDCNSSVVIFDAVNQAFEFEANQHPLVDVDSGISGVSYKDIVRLIACRTSLSICKTQFVFIKPADDSLYDELKIMINDFDIFGNQYQKPMSFEDNTGYEQKNFAVINDKYNVTPSTRLTISNIPAGSQFYIYFFPEQAIDISSGLKIYSQPSVIGK